MALTVDLELSLLSALSTGHAVARRTPVDSLVESSNVARKHDSIRVCVPVRVTLHQPRRHFAQVVDELDACEKMNESQKSDIKILAISF